MFYIVGLGNPGEEYKNTRHNVGFLVLDYLQTSLGLPGFVSSGKYSGEVSEGLVGDADVILLKPNTFMNNSGAAVKKLVIKEDVGNLVVIYDDIDLPLGEIKISVGRGDGGHNGIKSIISSLGSKDFVRVRVGISPRSLWTGKTKRPTGERLPKYVLGEFKKREEGELKSVMSLVAEAVNVVITDGVEKAMNRFN